MIDILFIRESQVVFSLSYYANVSEIFTPQDTANYVFEAWAQKRLFGCLIC